MTAWKLVVSCSLLVISLFLAPLSALAVSSLPSSSTSATTTYNLQPTTSLPPTIPPTSPLYTDLLVNNMFHTFSCLAVGQSVIGQPCLTYQITKNAQGAIQSVPVLSSVNLSGGTLGAVTSVIGALYMNPPVRTADYLASVGEGLGIVKQAHAQGVTGSGANVLKPIISLWQVSRNISYVIMIIIFVIIGLMIMFRNRINPQTVITAQTALPGLVIGLILITFSYFLAGLISDMAFIGTNIVGYYFSAAQNSPSGSTIHCPDSSSLVDCTEKANVLSIFSPLTGIIDKNNAATMLSNVWSSLSVEAQRLLTMLAMFITAQTTLQSTEFLKMIPKFGEAVQALLVGITVGATLTNPTALIGLALAFIATAILLYSMFKLLLRLINNYITIIFLTITAPFQFLAASLPGRQGIATGWILNMLANILAFPAVLAVFYFVAFLLGPNVEAVKKLPFQVSDKTAVTGISAFPLLGGLDLNFINLLLAFGALVALPSIPDIIGKTVGRASQAEQLIGQGIGAGIAQGRGYAGQFQQGVGAASSQFARARGLFNTPGYKMQLVPGTTDQYQIVETYEAGRGATFGTLSRRGITKPPKLEPGVEE
ncbi:MAG: hypothetical protein PHE48_00370 [Candidatus Daviesbacteria bacterium]|nr:hypothetical protein [Candidatus Daviesbacteria bacterium]